MKKEFVIKMFLIMFILLVFLFSILSFYFDSLEVVKKVYKLSELVNLLSIITVLLFIYFIYLTIRNDFVYKIFLAFTGQKELREEYMELKTFLSSMVLVALIFFVFSFTGITVFSGHKCRNNNFENCLIDQNTLRTVYIPNPGIYLFKKNETHSFKENEMVYFSALPDRDSEFVNYILLIGIPLLIVKVKKKKQV